MKTAYQHSTELIKNIRPEMAYNGEELSSWQKKAREKLYYLLGMDKFKKVAPDVEIEYEIKNDKSTEIKFSFQSEEGYRVPCHLLLPNNVENPPLMICLQGHSSGMHISLGRPKYEGDEEIIKGDRDFVVQAINNGFAAIAMEQRNFGECGGTEKGPDCYSESMNNLLLGRTTIGERVWDISRLIDVVISDFKDKVNIDKICCMGNSGGGTATAYLAALEDRICLAMPSCALCTYADSISAMHHCSCNFIPNIAIYFEMSDLVAMAYPKYYIQVSGIEDPIFPISGAELIYNQSKKAYAENNCADKHTLIKGNGGHRFYANEGWSQVKKYLSE